LLGERIFGRYSKKAQGQRGPCAFEVALKGSRELNLMTLTFWWVVFSAQHGSKLYPRKWTPSKGKIMIRPHTVDRVIS